MSLKFSAGLCGETRFSKLLGAATKDRIALPEVRPISVCIELLIQMEGSRAVVVKNVNLWFPVFGRDVDNP